MALYGTPEEEPAHDVLAADEFAMPAADPRLRHGPVVLPDDPSGIAEPHDVLAAEEFAMPAGIGGPAQPSLAQRHWSRVGATALVLALVGLRRRLKQH
jgi:hypothetical protein